MISPEKRLIIPLLGFNASGGVRGITYLANCLVEDGWQVIFLVPDYQSEPAFRLHPNVQVQVFKTFGFKTLRIIYAMLWFSLFACRQPGIYLANYYLTSLPIYFSYLLWGRKGIPVYFVLHYEPLSHVRFKQNKNAVIRWLLAQYAEFGYRLPYHKLTISDWIKSMLKQEDVTVIPLAIEKTVFYPAAQPKANMPLIIGAIGRTGAIKGFEIFLEALQPFTSRRDVQIHVLSDLPLELPPGFTKIESAGDHSVREFYQSCDIFVFTSHLEGFGLPPLEAMACGVPVITTDCGGVRQYANTDNALIVPVRDIQAIQQAVEFLIRDESKRKMLSIQGLRTSEMFFLERVCQQYCQFFNGFYTQPGISE